MREKHGSSIEKVGVGLVCSVETFKGCNINLVKRTSGFNGLSIYKSGEVRKIEVKTMEKSDYWIAINGFTAIDKLFFERDYWLYFVLLPENTIVMAKALPFIKYQLNLSKDLNFLDELEDWVKSTKKLSKSSGLKFIPRINIKFNKPIRELVKNFISGNYDKNWENAIPEIWQNRSNWEKIFSIEQI
jgi:hypothetical protein